MLPCGPTNVEFEFTVGRRSEMAIIEELGRVVINMCTIVPGGMIIFFPSYKYALELFLLLNAHDHNAHLSFLPSSVMRTKFARVRKLRVYSGASRPRSRYFGNPAMVLKLMPCYPLTRIAFAWKNRV